MNDKTGVNKFLRKTHVYGGLFLAFFAIVLGISSLQFQHNFIELRPAKKTLLWDQHVQIPDIENRQQLKSAIRDSLNLYGYLPWWEEYTDSLGSYHFMISRPGKQYWVRLPNVGSQIQVSERRTAFISTVFALHPLTAGFEGPGFAKIWRVLSEIMSILLLVIILLSIQLWYTKSFSRKWGWLMAGSVASFSIILIVLVWLVG